MIDIEKELKMAQIRHIKKELEQLRLYYNDRVDLEFLQILCSYEEMLELAVTTDERLILHKKMYQDSLNYLIPDVQDAESKIDFYDVENKNTCGTHTSDKLPFEDSTEMFSADAYMTKVGHIVRDITQI